MCRAVLEISGKFSKSQELTIGYTIMVYYGIPRHTLETLGLQLCWCWLHCLHEYGHHTTVRVTCTALLSKLCINIRRSVNCEILCNISKSQGRGNFSKTQELTIYTDRTILLWYWP